MHELLMADAFFQIMFGIKQQGERDFALFTDKYCTDIPHLGKVRYRTNRTFIWLDHIEGNARVMFQQGTGPAARAERGNRGQRQNVGG